ncbi:hypothetical protein A3Q56_07195 [Intoshia linei]|uniref:Conserved Oligomeric Golgi complex subunit 6 C-terminal domain-containing protein n=1 Tax=Intoshia linei TaxID=1819745 RepID=A0A177AU91_9BILA|nr:hypothetical protein A3Q56_07195 [Intoshia linei]
MPLNVFLNQIKQKISVLFQTSCETVCEWLKSLLSNQTYIDNYDYISLESGLHILAYNKDFLKICFDAYGKCQSEALISEITEFEHNLKSKIESKSSDPPISIDKTTKEDAIIRYISDLIAHIHQLIDSKLFIFSQIFKVFFENSDYKENDYIELLLKECILNIFNDMLIFLQLNIMKTVKNQKNIILTFKISTRIYLHENLLR